MAAINWPGLLAWSTKYHDGTAPSNFKVMTDEDRKFLEDAMEDAFGKIEDPNVIFQEAIEMTRKPDRTEETVITALEIMDRCADDPDVSRNVEKLGGLQALLDLLPVYPGATQVRVLEILALLFSNNPSIQEAGVKRGYMKAFLDLANSSPKASEERAKAFRALVALVRQVQAFEEALLRGADGMGLVIEMLSFDEEGKTREKALSFVRSLAGDGRLVVDDVKPLTGAIAPLFQKADAESISYRETLSSSALALAQAFPKDCPGALRTEVEARLTKMRAAKDPDADIERASCEECLSALG